jgi:hypothetical protein
MIRDAYRIFGDNIYEGDESPMVPEVYLGGEAAAFYPYPPHCLEIGSHGKSTTHLSLIRALATPSSNEIGIPGKISSISLPGSW